MRTILLALAFLAALVEASPGQTPISLNQPVTASTYQTGNDPANANDGNLTTRWAAASAAYPQWWTVDLGSTQHITQAVIHWYNSSSRAYQYQIQISNDGTNYTVLVDNTGNSIFADTTNNFSAVARYVRIYVTGCSDSAGYASFYEGQIFGGATSSTVIQPYAPDAHTLVLFHFDEAAGSSTFTNVGSLGGTADSVDMSTASANPPVVTTVSGATAYPGFGNAVNLNMPGYMIGFDADNNGTYDGEVAESIPMSELNMGNGGQTPWTLEAMIYPSVTNANQEIISTDSSAAHRGFQFRINTAGQLELNLIDTGPDILTPIPISGPNAYAPDTWYHVAATYDGTNIVLYWTKVDSSITEANPISTNAAAVGTTFGAVQGPLVIGNENRGSSGENFRGLIDEVRISSVARAANQMIFSSSSLSASPTLISPANPVDAGTLVTLSSIVTGTNPISYFWQSDGGSGGLAWTNLPNSTTNTCVVDTTGLAAGSYQYRLVVTNSGEAVTNTPATMNLIVGNIQSISINPTNNPVYAGTPVSLSASVSGLSLAYLWQTDNGSGGANWNTLAGSRTNTYGIDTSSMTPATYQYRLVLTNPSGSVTSSVVALNLAAASGPVLANDTVISPATAYTGESVSMSASFTGTQPMTYQWYKITSGITNPLAGATSTTYAIAGAQTNDSGSYFPTASNDPPGLGSQTASSTPATLTVLAGVAPPNTNSEMFCDLLQQPQETVISDPNPKFGWVYHPSFRNDYQSAYHIIVASSQSLASAGTGDMWDSGWVTSSNSINVPYAGSALMPNTSYFWRVQTKDSAGTTRAFSEIQQFNMASQLSNPLTTSGVVYQQPSGGSVNCYPLRYVSVPPVLVTNTAPGVWFVDFGKDAFGFATVQINGNYSGTTVNFGLGEAANGYAVNTSPPDAVRYRSGSYPLQNGDFIYTNRSSVAVGTISPPTATYGIVSPFRYLELTGVPTGVTLTTNDLTQQRLQTEFDNHAATFDSSSANLNQVWALCKYSMEALSFDGIYVDGDRERTPYEADTYIHMLSSYAVNDDFTTPRCSFEYLTRHLTWPTEWPMQMVFVAWADYQQTGDPYLITKYYGFLTNKCMLLRRFNPTTGLVESYPVSGNTASGDIIDWLRISGDGIGNTDGYVPEATNAVINAFFYRDLTLMTHVAQVTGHTTDAANFSAMANQVYSSYNNAFWDASSQSYIDGEGTTHSSADANFFPLAFGLVPTNREAAVVNYIRSRIVALGAMPAGVYGAQYLLDGLFDANDTDTALGLITTNSTRSWMNMINIGSTITDEAWSLIGKGNEDWNHAWGAAAGNLIARYVLGVRPRQAGYGQIVIQPQLGTTLSYLNGTVPTIRGPVSIAVTNAPNHYQMSLTIPGNVTATVMLPCTNNTALLDGSPVSGTLSNGWLTLQHVGSGQHTISSSATAVTNSAPTAVNDTASTGKNTSVTISPLVNDYDPDGDALTLTALAPTNGVASIVSGTNVLFTPATNFTGTATIGYAISDGSGGTAGALITVEVTNITSTSYPTNITWSLMGGTNLVLSWPASHLGWYAQSNSVALDVTNDWHDIPGSQNSTNLSITINPAQPQVYYRLQYPNP